MSKKAVISLVILIVCLTQFASAQNTDKEFILNKVKALPLPEAPHYIAATYIVKEQPQIIASVKFPNVQTGQYNAIVTSRLGRGKLVVIGSSAYLRKPFLENQEVKRLLKNTLTWSVREKRPAIQLWQPEADLQAFLEKEKYLLSVLGADHVINPKTNILILTEDVPDALHRNNIANFIRAGGTLIFGSSLANVINKPTHPSEENHTLQLNNIFKEAGLVQLTHFISATGNYRTLVLDSAPDYLHFTTLLEAVKKGRYGAGGAESHLATATIDAVITYNSLNSPEITKLKGAYNLKADSLIFPTIQNPISKDSKSFTRYLLHQKLIAKQLQEEANPHYIAPASKIFPGTVPPTAPRVTEQVDIPVQVGRQGLWEPQSVFYRWHSTGLYVPAGENVQVKLNASNIKLNLKAQIGVHTDNLLASEVKDIRREPVDLTRSFTLTQGVTEIYSRYGGILLINIPDTTSLKAISIEVKGAVKYPYYKLGKTSLVDWQKNIRHYQAPWAELATDKIILTVPASRIRNLDNPEKLMKFWDEVLDANASLAHISKSRGHPERIIVDDQVAFGAMFTAEARIVVPNDQSCAQMLDEAFMRTHGSWGHFHELGHRHQFWGIDFDGLGEVSVNLFTLYVYDKVLKKGIYNHENLTSKAAVKNRVQKYLASGASFGKFTEDSFLALCMYMQLIENFGWHPIEQVYKAYRALPVAQYPKTDVEKTDFWFTSICAATQKDLSAFFQKWQVPVSSQVKLQVAKAKYPEWLPAEMR